MQAWRSSRASSCGIRIILSLGVSPPGYEAIVRRAVGSGEKFLSTLRSIPALAGGILHDDLAEESIAWPLINEKSPRQREMRVRRIDYRAFNEETAPSLSLLLTGLPRVIDFSFLMSTASIIFFSRLLGASKREH